MDHGTINVGGQTVAYRESTGTGRPVVFVHGNSASSRTWRHLLDGPFGRRLHGLALDLPGHGASPAASDPAAYSLPGYAAVLAGFAQALDLRDAVFVGHSLGGHVVLEATESLPDAAGLAIFGTPPMAGPADMAAAFLPNPAVNVGFAADVSEADAQAYAASFLAPGSSLPLDDFVADILATDGAARQGLLASVGAGRFKDEVAIVAALRAPIAVLHGRGEQLVSLDYLQTLSMPTLWRGAVQILDGAGHAPQEERPEEFAALLELFIDDLG